MTNGQELLANSDADKNIDGKLGMICNDAQMYVCSRVCRKITLFQN